MKTKEVRHAREGKGLLLCVWLLLAVSVGFHLLPAVQQSLVEFAVIPGPFQPIPAVTTHTQRFATLEPLPGDGRITKSTDSQRTNLL